MADSLVSVVIPCYNYGQYLAEAIDSALAQTYGPVEIIVIDDGSTDQSVAVAKRFGSKIRLVEQPNRGVVAARNRGLAESQGQFVCFLDADDILAPEYVQKLVAIFQLSDSSVALAYCDIRVFGQEEGIVKSCPWNPRKLLYRNYVPTAALVQRRVLEEVGGYSSFPQTEYSFEDWELWLKIAEAGYTGAYVSEAMFGYRFHGAGRNVVGRSHDRELRRNLARWHPELYCRWDNRLYLAVFGTLSKVRNLVIKPIGV